MLVKLAKSKDCHDTAQLLMGAMFISCAISIMFNIYYCKTRIEVWDKGNWNEIRIWLFIECMWFFQWIASGIYFLAMAYLFKFKSFT